MTLPTEHNLHDFSVILEQAIEVSGTGIWDRDVTSGMIRYSAGWFTILGYDTGPASNYIEASYARVHPDDLPAVKAAIQAHFDQKTPIYEAEHRLRCLDGSYKWVLSRGRVTCRDRTGRALRMIGTTTDVTATRDLTEQLKVLHEQACQHSIEIAAMAAELTQQTEALIAAHRLARVGSWRWLIAKRCLWFSPEIWWILGQSPSDEPISYEQMRAMFHPEDYIRAMDGFYDGMRNRRSVILEYRMTHPDGSMRDVLTHAEPVFGPNGEVIELRGTSQDITSYRQVESALRESEDHYRHMVKLSPQISWTAAPDGSILEIDSKWLDLTGQSLDETIPFGWIKVLHPDDQARAAAIWAEHLRTGDPLDLEYRICLVTGDYGWMRTRAAPRRDSRDDRIIRWYGTHEDVTDRYKAEVARQASEALAFRVLEATSDAVIVFDQNARISFANARAVSMMAKGRPLVGHELRSLFPGAPAHSLQEAISKSIATGESVQLELYWPPTGLWLEASAHVGEGDVSLFLSDISERIRARQELGYAATHDLMTGTFNRATLFAQLSDELRRQSDNNLVALLCLDLDYFKEVNDTHGHPVGDALLCQVAIRLRSCLRAKDVLARCGGDEFAIMQTCVKNAHDVTTLAKRILDAMRAPFEIEGLLLAGRMSIGIALSTPGATDQNELYSRADRALYHVKRRSRGWFQIFNPKLDTAFNLVRHLRSDITEALTRGEFLLTYQPIVRLADYRIVGFEALIRWCHDKHGWIPPDDFIPIAEESGQIVAIGAWVLHTACMTARDWPEAVKVSVNVSSRQFELGDLYETVRITLKSTGLSASRLNLEVTETVLLTQHPDTLRTLRNLRALGVTLVLDDFGRGYSSLAYLNTFSFDLIKIDKSFISRIQGSDDQQPVFEAILGIAAALGIPVTAEGVETETQLDYIKRMGCSYAQGYLFSIPLQANSVRASLDDGGLNRTGISGGSGT